MKNDLLCNWAAHRAGNVAHCFHSGSACCCYIAQHVLDCNCSLIGTHSCIGEWFFFFFRGNKTSQNSHFLLTDAWAARAWQIFRYLPPFCLPHLWNSPLLIKGMACPLSCDCSFPDRILTGVWADRPFFFLSHSQSLRTRLSEWRRSVSDVI